MFASYTQFFFFKWKGSSVRANLWNLGSFWLPYSHTSYANACSAGWYLYFLCRLQLVCAGCKVVSCADAVGSLRGIEAEGWVGLRRKSSGAAGLEPVGEGVGAERRECPLKRVQAWAQQLLCVWVLHWGVCCSLGSPRGSWDEECWREQIRPGWSNSYTSTSAWRTRSPVWQEIAESRSTASASHLMWGSCTVTSSVSPCCTDSSVLFLAMKSYIQL